MKADSICIWTVLLNTYTPDYFFANQVYLCAEKKDKKHGTWTFSGIVLDGHWAIIKASTEGKLVICGTKGTICCPGAWRAGFVTPYDYALVLLKTVCG